MSVINLVNKIAIDANRNKNHGSKDMIELEREAKVLQIQVEEGYFK